MACALASAPEPETRMQAIRMQVMVTCRRIKFASRTLPSCLPAAVHMKRFADILLTPAARLAVREVLARTCKFSDCIGLPSTRFTFELEKLALAKILIVDDDSAVRATVQLLLERAGHSVVAANDGRKGLAIFETGDFDLLFLDIFMPGMDGFETMRLVHQQQPLIPIIVISGNPVTFDSVSGPDFLTMATKLGAVSSLQKPFKPAALLAAVTASLAVAMRPLSSSVQADDLVSGP
jgi:CheY-like chemotaxis protein